MRIISSLIGLATLVNSQVGVAKADEQDKPSLRLASRERQSEELHNDSRDLLDIQDLLYKDPPGEKRRKKRYSGYIGDDDYFYSKGAKGGKGGKSGKGFKGSKGSKATKGGGRRKRMYRDDKDKCEGNGCDDGFHCPEHCCSNCGGDGPICEVYVYEFVGQTGSFLAKDGEDGPIENEMFALYAVDDFIYEPDGELDTKISSPEVSATGKCMQASKGKFCDGTDDTCCPGLTDCDIQFKLGDEFGRIGDVIASGGLLDNAKNVLPVTGGSYALLNSYGEVEITAVYVDEIENEGCPNISEVLHYDVEAKIYVQECEGEVIFALPAQQLAAMSANKKKRKNTNP